MSAYKYTKTWFLASDIKSKLLNVIDPHIKHSILEIGCYEGLSSVFFADNLLDHPDSSLTCVDPFMNDQQNDHAKYLTNNEGINVDR